jgi:hypothetical protein
MNPFSKNPVSRPCLIQWLGISLILALAASGQAQVARVVPGHVVSVTRQLPAVDELPATNRLHLFLGLPLRNQFELNALLEDLHDPASTNFHHWLTPEDFTGRFGPTEEDYQKVVHYAGQHGFTVTHTHANRMMVNVDAPVSEIEKTFQIKLHRYQHPTESRLFYAPDSEPTVETNIPILHIAGLDNYSLPHRFNTPLRPLATGTNSIVAYASGSGPGGNFMGKDFRTAYVPGVTNTGAGQYIAIVDVGGPYYPLDVYMYETNAGLSTNTVVTNILTSGGTGIAPTNIIDEGEEVLDIDMAMSMAPGATILNYEGEGHNVFNQIAIDNKAKQMTLSYGFGIDAIIQQIFQQFVAQGQAMSQASGDGGADLDGGTGLTGAPYSTIVGGVSLATSGAGGPWQSNPTWGGSGGGISGYGIPTWQQGINMTTNLGSVSFRNYPDVAMPADNIFTVYKDGTVIGGTGGTSAASPLWAGFMALVNQQAATEGKPAVGFINPAIYAIGKGSHTIYTNCFHDVTTGNTFNGHNALRYQAYPGYDLCTGWGTPMGSNTITALAGAGTNDFVFYPSQAVFTLLPGGSANGTITMTGMNGLAGSASFSISGFPSAITAAVAPITTTNATSFTLATTSNTVPGSYSGTLTGTLGGLTHAVALTVVVNRPVPGSGPVNLAQFYNRTGIYTDGQTFGSGIDSSGYAFSGNLLGRNLSWNGLLFGLGAPNIPDVVYCAGQTINLTAGRFNTLQMLATGVQGSQTGIFTITYTDNSSLTVTQQFSDWANPQSYPGESTVVTMPYRDSSGSSQALNVTVDGYIFTLNQTKTVQSITLPINSDLVILSVLVANDPVSASLGSFYNRAGIYDDGVTYTNPATGGLDGEGSSYSGTLLGGSLTWSNTVFNFGPANTTNMVATAGQTIPLPSGSYAALRLLGTGIQGGQPAQSFVVTYSDSTTATFSQGLSDWFNPANYAGETKAVVMGHRNSSDGTADNRTFYLYGYSFNLNSTKTATSIRLPNNGNVMIAAISLVPNWPPTFDISPFALPAANAGQVYTATISTNANDLNGGTLTYAEVSGPSWLTVAANGTVSGEPLSANAGTNTFVVSVTDSGGLSSTGNLNINVLPAPPINATLSLSGTNLVMNWVGGISPYQIMMSTDLTIPGWVGIGTSTSNSFIITQTNSAAYYRIIGQ